VSFFLAYVSILSGCGEKFTRYDIIEEKCSKCHKSELVYMKKTSRQDWERILHGMKVRGLRLTASEEKEVKDILFKHLIK